MDITRSALVIIDMVNDFVRPKGALHVPGAEGCAPAIASLRKAFHAGGGLVLFLCDAHDPQDPEFESWPDHSVRGTEGAQVITELAPESGDIVIPKCCIDTFKQPEFPELLACRKIETLIVTGVATEYCVLATALGGRRHGYDVTVVEDAVRGVDLKEGDVDKAIRSMREAGCRFAPSGKVLAEIEG